MKIAFVGHRKDYRTIDPSYVRTFNKFHLEIPWYYAEKGGNQVVLTTVGRMELTPEEFPSGGSFQCLTEDVFKDYLTGHGRQEYDAVVHWREWNEDLYVPDAINLLHTCDHTYPPSWKMKVKDAFNSGKLYGILCYRTWHKRQIAFESGLPEDRLFTDCTLGVDTEIYRPSSEKDAYKMLWSSDPGRGLQEALMLAMKLHQMDKRFRLHVCHPDYVKGVQRINHPAIVWEGNVPNGRRLWDLFNTSGVVPYTSTFMEPSSRAHRQGQAAGAMVLYPPGMGSPSELIRHDVDGIVAPINEWPKIIYDRVRSGDWFRLGMNGHKRACLEDWNDQAQRFNTVVASIKGAV